MFRVNRVNANGKIRQAYLHFMIDIHKHFSLTCFSKFHSRFRINENIKGLFDIDHFFNQLLGNISKLKRKLT